MGVRHSDPHCSWNIFCSFCFYVQVSKGFFMTKPNMKTKASVFSMGQRSEVLSTDLEAPILVPHALEKTGTKVSLKIPRHLKVSSLGCPLKTRQSPLPAPAHTRCIPLCQKLHPPHFKMLKLILQVLIAHNKN